MYIWISDHNIWLPCPQKKCTSLCVTFLQWSKKFCPNNNKSCKLLIRFCKYRLLSEQWFARTPHHIIVSTTTRTISCHNYSLLPYLLGSSWGKKIQYLQVSHKRRNNNQCSLLYSKHLVSIHRKYIPCIISFAKNIRFSISTWTHK